MARKSRKGTAERLPAVKDVVAGTAVAPAAVYARLSVENSGKDDGGDSIANQVGFCREFLKDHPELRLEAVYEDNGEKGTHFDRPQFQKMMEDIRRGRIRCVIVKDLSRFGRDYIECGYYLEKIFPFMGVRFIAITDRYDSLTAGDAEGTLMVPLKNMVNAAYAKDISRKIITSFRARQDKGEFLPSFAPYGYVKSETRAYRFEPDPETAPYVKLIFEWFAEGVCRTEISRRLTEMGAVTPAMRKVQLGIWKAGKYRHTDWYGRSLVDILKNAEYTGCIVYGRMPKSLYEGIRCHRTPPEEWKVIPDTHEALVSRELYDRVQERFERQKRHYYERLEACREVREQYRNLFRGKIVCGDCGKNMRYRLQAARIPVPSYDCGGFIDSRGKRCSRHHIQARKVEEAVWQAVRSQIGAMCSLEEVIRKLKGHPGEAAARCRLQKKIQEISLQLAQVNEKKAGLYENLVEGILDDAEYQYAKERYEKDFRKLNARLEEAVKEKKDFDSVMGAGRDCLRTARSLAGLDCLGQDAVDCFVKEVRVYEGSRIEVTLNYAEDIGMMERIVQEVGRNA